METHGVSKPPQMPPPQHSPNPPKQTQNPPQTAPRDVCLKGLAEFGNVWLVFGRFWSVFGPVGFNRRRSNNVKNVCKFVVLDLGMGGSRVTPTPTPPLRPLPGHRGYKAPERKGRAHKGILSGSRIAEQTGPNPSEINRGRWSCGQGPPVNRRTPFPEHFPLRLCVFSGP